MQFHHAHAVRHPVELLARAAYRRGWRPTYRPGPSCDRLVETFQGALASVS